MNTATIPTITKYFERERGDRERVPDLREHGFYVYKMWGMWDWCPHYRNDAGDILYYHRDGNDGRARRLMTGEEVLADLTAYWRPAADDERNWMILSMEAYFRGE